MTIRVTIRSAGSERLLQRINNAANFLRTAGMRRVLNSYSGDVVKQFKQNIDEMTPGNVQDLKESTKKQKQAKYGRVYPILRATDLLYNGMKASVANTSDGWVIRITYPGDRGRVAQVHQDGEGNMPQRDFAKIPTALRRKLWADVRAALRST